MFLQKDLKGLSRVIQESSQSHLFVISSDLETCRSVSCAYFVSNVEGLGVTGTSIPLESTQDDISTGCTESIWD